MMRYTFDELYNAMVRKDRSFEGIFVTAVKTTGIFCRPVCNARKPKPGNVVFYATTQEALSEGYRPCLICRPMEKEGDAPEYINRLFSHLTQHPQIKLRDEDVRKLDIDPVSVRRWFQKQYGISFQAYQRMRHFNNAFHKVASGEKVITAAFDSGYNSLSGFNDGFKMIFGSAPSLSKTKTIINVTRFSTPLGQMIACATAAGLCLLEFTNRRKLAAECANLERLLQGVLVPGENSYLSMTIKELEEYFAGARKQFTVPLHTPGTPFQQDVWRFLRTIDYGKTLSYQQQSRLLGNEKAIRAIAAANGANRIAIIIPCHRVVNASGELGGYGGGLPKKQWLLEFESRQEQQVLPFSQN